MELWVLWLIIIFILIVAEVSTVNLVSIWFIASGIVSMILSIFYDNFFVQFAVFVILGILLLLTTRKFLEKLIHSSEDTKTNLDRIIGSTAIVTEAISKNTVGEAKVEGKKWSAISKEDLDIGEEAIIESIDGVKLIVRKKEK